MSRLVYRRFKLPMIAKNCNIITKLARPTTLLTSAHPHAVASCPPIQSSQFCRPGSNLATVVASATTTAVDMKPHIPEIQDRILYANACEETGKPHSLLKHFDNT